MIKFNRITYSVSQILWQEMKTPTLFLLTTLSLLESHYLVCEIPRSFERSSPSDFRMQGSFIHINSRKIFERDLLSSDSKICNAKALGFLRLYWRPHNEDQVCWETSHKSILCRETLLGKGEEGGAGVSLTFQHTRDIDFLSTQSFQESLLANQERCSEIQFVLWVRFSSSFLN